jgi:PIN domain
MARAIVLDANILVRAILGSRVLGLLADRAARATFLAPDVAFDDAREHLPAILAKRGVASDAIGAALEKLDALSRVVVSVPAESYLAFEAQALARIGRATRRLAGFGMRLGCGLSHLDRGRRLFRCRRRDVDHGHDRLVLRRRTDALLSEAIGAGP